MDLKLITDEELAALPDLVLVEQARRESLLAIPAQLAYLANEFMAAGGKQSVLKASIAYAQPVTPVAPTV